MDGPLNDARLPQVLHALDTQLRESPNESELLYGVRMSEALALLFADTTPSPLLQIACRGQHLGRHTTPRGDFAEGRVGYLQWRKFAAAEQARKVTRCMHNCGYADAECDVVALLIEKRDLGRVPDSDAQCLEDAACLVFLRYELPDFAKKHSNERVAEILRKTQTKMSPRALTLAAVL